MNRSRRRNAHMQRTRARRRALQALYQWEMTRQDSADIVRQFGEEQDMSRVDVAYFEELVRDTIAAATDLSEALGEYVDRDWQQIDLMERSVLLIGACELRDRREIPYRVAINEAVDLAGQFGTDQSADYVNAILDRCARSWRADEYRQAASR